MKNHALWLDTLNMNIQAGKTLREALLCADALSQWPFKYLNGEQTPESRALEDNKAAHKDPKFNPNTCEESPL